MSDKNRAESSHERSMTRHRLGAVLISPFCIAIRPPIFSTVFNNRTLSFYPPAASCSIATGSMMGPTSWARLKWPRSPVATAPRAHGLLISDRETIHAFSPFSMLVAFSLYSPSLATNMRKSRHCELSGGLQSHQLSDQEGTQCR